MINYLTPLYTNSLTKKNGTFKNNLISIDGLAYKKSTLTGDISPVINTADGLQFELDKNVLMAFKKKMTLKCLKKSFKVCF